MYEKSFLAKEEELRSIEGDIERMDQLDAEDIIREVQSKLPLEAIEQEKLEKKEWEEYEKIKHAQAEWLEIGQAKYEEGEVNGNDSDEKEEKKSPKLVVLVKVPSSESLDSCSREIRKIWREGSLDKWASGFLSDDPDLLEEHNFTSYWNGMLRLTKEDGAAGKESKPLPNANCKFSRN